MHPAWLDRKLVGRSVERKHVPSPTGQLGTLWSKVTEPSCNHGGSDGLPANVDSKARQAARISGEAARASGSPLHVPSLLLPRITRSWVHCVVGIAMQCPETFGRYRWLFAVRVVGFWAAGQDTPKDNPDRSIALAVHLAVRSV